MDKAIVGVLPARQLRSEQTRDRLVDAGYQLILEKPLSEITISDIASKAGCSVGAFYRRFENKEAFEEALLTTALQKAREMMMEIFETTQDYRVLCDALVHQTVTRHITFAPIYKAAILKYYNEPTRNFATRQHGRFLMAGFLDWARRILGRDLEPWETLRITMSFQMLFGTIINALLGRPGPYMPEQPEFADELAFTFLRNIETVFTSAPSDEEPGSSRNRNATGRGRHSGTSSH